MIQHYSSFVQPVMISCHRTCTMRVCVCVFSEMSKHMLAVGGGVSREGWKNSERTERLGELKCGCSQGSHRNEMSVWTERVGSQNGALSCTGFDSFGEWALSPLVFPPTTLYWDTQTEKDQENCRSTLKCIRQVFRHVLFAFMWFYQALKNFYIIFTCSVFIKNKVIPYFPCILNIILKEAIKFFWLWGTSRVQSTTLHNSSWDQ